MNLGIKVNADTESFDRLSRSDAAFAEVWFDATHPDRYTDLFDELRRRSIGAGLHFWGLLDNQILPNIAHQDTKISTESKHLIKSAIDIAAKRGFSYVNIHPGSMATIRCDFDAQRYDILSDPAPYDDCVETFIQNALELDAYAKRHGVLFTVETVPMRITDGWYSQTSRYNPKNAYELPVQAIIRAAQSGIYIANDFSHTAANIITDDPDAIWTFVRGITERLAPMTKLIHIGFIVPPYNGTDNHDEFDNPMLETAGAVPNNTQLIELLTLFKHRDDVYMLAEPKSDHVKNYQLVKVLMEKASKI